jgi:hypothetical protein
MYHRRVSFDWRAVNYWRTVLGRKESAHQGAFDNKSSLCKGLYKKTVGDIMKIFC